MACKKIRILISIALLIPFSVYGQLLSPAAEISMLTGTPGQELYSTFGHSAIRIHDPNSNMDWVFNYGTFDFDTPNFYMKFLRGKLDYMLSIAEYDRFKMGYHYGRQSVTEQIMNLDSTEKQAVFDFLMNNYRTENRYYKYDFFYDNCATRIRDLFVEIYGDRLRFDYPAVWHSKPLSFRQLLDVYLVSKPWSDWGIDIVLGLPADKKANPDQYMYLPEFMMEAFDCAQIVWADGERPLVKSSEVIIDSAPKETPGFQITPRWVNWGLFILVALATFYEIRKRKTYKGLDYILFTAVGLIGWLIVFLWFFTDHIATKNNLNIFWALPTHLPLIYFILRKSHTRLSRGYWAVTFLLALALLLFWALIPQQFHWSLVPILLVIITRCGLHLGLFRT
jgi:hypothetical protein